VERPRTRSKRNFRPLLPDGSTGESPTIGTNTGALASAAWLAARDIAPNHTRWSVEVALDSASGGELHCPPVDARFVIEVFAGEWGFAFTRGDAVSWIRVTDIAFVHGRDDFELLRRTPRLDGIGAFLRMLEDDHAVTLNRNTPLVRSSVGNEDRIAAWARNL
jgi:hypothetical protein